MEIVDQTSTVVVADVGATFVRVALWREGSLGPIVDRPVADLERDPGTGIATSRARLLDEAAAAGWSGIVKPSPATPRPVAIGIGICAAIDDRDAVQKPLDFGVPAGTVLPDVIREATGLPVAIDNDANMAALGELVGEHVEPRTLAAKLLAVSGAASVVVTLGGKGAIVAEPDMVTHVPAPMVRVLDTTGAGDVFCGAVAVALAEGRTLVEAATWGCSAATAAVSRPGSIPSFPSRAEVPPPWDLTPSATPGQRS